MIQPATISVECDSCGDTAAYNLTKLAAAGEWDERNLREDMTRDGWKFIGEKTYCDGCEIPEEDET